MSGEDSVPVTAERIDYDWLRARPSRWRHAIAARPALRVLPLGVTTTTSDRETSDIALAVFRATSISRFMPLCAEEEYVERDPDNYLLVPSGSASEAASAIADLVPTTHGRAAVQAAADAASTVAAARWAYRNRRERARDARSTRLHYAAGPSTRCPRMSWKCRQSPRDGICSQFSGTRRLCRCTGRVLGVVAGCIWNGQ